MKKLETEDIRLEPYSYEHIAFFKQWREYYGEHFFGHWPESFDCLANGYEGYEKDNQAGKKLWFVIYEKNLTPMEGTSLPIGMIGLTDIDFENGKAELGQMFLNQDRRGHGFMDQAIGLLLEHCFQEFRMVVVYLWTWEGNQDALRCYERCGFMDTGFIPNAFYHDGHHHVMKVMAITKGVWDGREKVKRIAEKEKAAA